MSAPQPAAAGPGDTRLSGLPEGAVPRMHAAARAIRDGAFDTAEGLLNGVLARAPGHPEALRLRGILFTRRGRPAEARDVLRRASALHPGDVLLLNDLGNALRDCGERDEAFATWRRASELAPREPMPHYNLGRNLLLEGRTGPALEALERACALAPSFVPAQVMFGDALTYVGRFDDADAAYRAALRAHPASGDAWRGLTNMKVRPLSTEDRGLLSDQLRRPDIGEHDRVSMGYALGKVCEDQGDYLQAFAAVSEANTRLNRAAPWDAAAFHALTDAVLAQTEALPAPLDPALGREVIFLVGLPRSASTLFEQILAAHPEVEGSSELPDLGEIINGESVRRGRPFPRWVGEATAEDWQRLGREYLSRTARWRERRPRSTDKMPDNWLYAGVLRAMLPGAKIIETRRDLVEVGWSCFKQHFYRLPHFSCDLSNIAAYAHDSARALSHWANADPARVRTYSYEALIADPEGEIRSMLTFCGLPFDARCLDFHRAERSVRTPSASQVRQPLRGDTARAVHYGDLLAPLRAPLDA